MRTISTFLFSTMVAAACTGSTGPQGEPGDMGAPGSDGAPGSNGAPGSGAQVDVVQLPGDAFFPESLNAGSDGTLYATSAITGEIAAISPDRAHVTLLVPAETQQPAGKTGVLVDDAHGLLWTCAIATDFSVPTEVRSYDLTTGALTAKHALIGGVCNDMVFDGAGNLYVTDSFVGIERLPAGGSAIDASEWAQSPLLEPATEGDFAADGIVMIGSDLYVDNLEKGTLVRVPIAAGGAAGTPVEVTDGSGASLGMTAPDGIRLVDGGLTIAVAESAGDTVSKLVVDPATNTATREVLTNRLDRPSAVVQTSDGLWASEGQIFRAFGLDDTPVNIPFQVVRVDDF